ncbi:MAG: hypothetical protein GQ554_09045 [Deltaproteobacteria bacterium]|nr:hypothetical protein [Deltaproteobacteria bacterium]
MAIKCGAIGKSNGSKSIKEHEQKGIPDAHLEEMVKNMKDEKTEKRGHENRCT